MKLAEIVHECAKKLKLKHKKRCRFLIEQEMNLQMKIVILVFLMFGKKRVGVLNFLTCLDI